MQKSKIFPDVPLWQALALQPSAAVQNFQMSGIDALGLEPAAPLQNQIRPESEETHAERIAMLKQEQKKMSAARDKDDDESEKMSTACDKDLSVFVAQADHFRSLLREAAASTGVTTKPDCLREPCHAWTMPKPPVPKKMPKKRPEKDDDELDRIRSFLHGAQKKSMPEPPVPKRKPRKQRPLAVGPDEDVAQELKRSWLEARLEDVEARIYCNLLEHMKLFVEPVPEDWWSRKQQVKTEKQQLELEKQGLLEQNRQLQPASSSSSLRSSSSMLAPAAHRTSVIQNRGSNPQSDPNLLD